MQSVSIPSLLALVGFVLCLAHTVAPSPLNRRCAPCNYPCISMNNVQSPTGCPVCHCPPSDFPWNDLVGTPSVVPSEPVSASQTPSSDPESDNILPPPDNASRLPFGIVNIPIPQEASAEKPVAIQRFGAPVISSIFNFATSSEEEHGRIESTEVAPRLPAGLEGLQGFAEQVVYNRPLVECPESDPCPGHCPVGIDENGCQICGCGAAFFSNDRPAKKTEKVVFDF